jgi:hypothetical protein
MRVCVLVCAHPWVLVCLCVGARVRVCVCACVRVWTGQVLAYLVAPLVAVVVPAIVCLILYAINKLRAFAALAPETVRMKTYVQRACHGGGGGRRPSGAFRIYAFLRFPLTMLNA